MQLPHVPAVLSEVVRSSGVLNTKPRNVLEGIEARLNTRHCSRILMAQAYKVTTKSLWFSMSYALETLQAHDSA